jgi:hypothetical protein
MRVRLINALIKKLAAMPLLRSEFCATQLTKDYDAVRFADADVIQLTSQARQRWGRRRDMIAGGPCRASITSQLGVDGHRARRLTIGRLQSRATQSAA